MNTIYTAEHIFPMTGEDVSFQHIVVEDGNITDTGTDISEKYSNIKRINYPDRTIIPAFIDTHTHFSSFGFCVDTLPLFDFDSLEEIAANIRDYIKNNPKRIYILFGLSPYKVKERRLFTKAELDKVEPKRPLFVLFNDGHGAVANSAVADKYKLNNSVGYDFEKGQYFLDSFYEIYKRITLRAPKLDFIVGLRKAADFSVQQGVTTVGALQGEGVPFNADLKAVRLYSRFSPVRIIPYYQTRSITSFRLSRLKSWGGCFECAIDGSFSPFDAAMKEPYCVDTPIEGNQGRLFYPPNELINMVVFAERKGIQLAVHAIGDRAVEAVLNIYKAHANKNNKNEHRIEHAVILDDEMIGTIAAHHIHIATQPMVLSGCIDPLWFMERILGRERYINRFMPLKKMVEAGITVSGSSDAPVTPINPISGIHAAVNHFNPEQRLSVYDAMKMFTVNGAKGVRMSDILGTLEKGKSADFVVLDQNPFRVAKEKLKHIRVLDVYREGIRIGP